MTIPPRFLDELRNRLSVSDVIGKRIKVTRAGREFKACCPFHKEKTPSFTINDDKQFYHCFGCGAHGDVIGFVMQHDNLSFIDAVESLSVEAGMQMPKPDPEALKKAEQAKSLHMLLEEATQFQENILHNSKEGQAALQYLLGRGMTPEIMQSFRVGYAPADGQALRKHLLDKGYTDAQMMETGVIRKSSKGGDPYSFFRERIMFPVSDRRGRVVAFGGRILPDHLRPPDREGYTAPKYINSADTTLFDKGRMLYGESLARQAVRDGQPVIVTEGYMDVIACHQAGFSGAVAPMGTALTEDQILSLWSMIVDEEKVPVLCFDGDEAGRRAASRSCERIMPLLKPAQSVRFAFLPEGEDPDSLLQAGGATGFKKVLDSAISLFDFIWAAHTAGRNFETPESRAGVTKALGKDVQNIADREVQTHYRALLRNRISDVFFIRKNQKQNYKKSNFGSVKLRRPVFKPSDVFAKILLASVLNHPRLYGVLEEFFGQYKIESKNLNQLRQEIILCLEDDAGLDREALQTHLKQSGYEQELGDILSESVYVHAVFARPDIDENEVQRGLFEWLQEVEGRDWSEISDGWKKASNEDDEEKLRQMVHIKASDGG